MLRRRDIRNGLHFVRQVFTDSHNSARLIRRVYGHEATVVWPGVDDKFFLVPRRKNEGTEFRLLTVSRLSRDSRKNVDSVIRALCLLPRGLDVNYTIVGDGDDRGRLEVMSKDIGVSDRVVFTGRVSDAELIDHYRTADLFVLTPEATDLDVEGFGMVYAEASATGTPVLGSMAGGATDAIADGINGILIERSTPQSIADGIVRYVRERSHFRETEIRNFAEQFRFRDVTRSLRTHISDRLSRR